MATAEATRTSGAPARISRESLRAGFFRSGLPAKSQAGFTAAILAVFLIGFFSYRSSLQRAEASRQVAHTIDVTDHLDALLSTFQDAETGQRGYLLTGDERYLEPYHAATAALQAEFPRLRVLVSDNPHELERLEVLERLAANKNAELRQTIDLRRAGRIDQALEIVRTDRGKQAMDEIRKTIAGMRTDERELLDVRGRDLESATTVVTSVIWGGSALLAVLDRRGGQHVVARLHGPADAGVDPHRRERAGGPHAGAGRHRDSGPADRDVPGRVPEGRAWAPSTSRAQAERCGGWAATRCPTTAATPRSAA